MQCGRFCTAHLMGLVAQLSGSPGVGTGRKWGRKWGEVWEGFCLWHRKVFKCMCWLCHTRSLYCSIFGKYCHFRDTSPLLWVTQKVLTGTYVQINVFISNMHTYLCVIKVKSYCRALVSTLILLTSLDSLLLAHYFFFVWVGLRKVCTITKMYLHAF